MPNVDDVIDSGMLSSVPRVDLDEEGVFKYILIKVTSPKSKEECLIVRGYASCPYHADILEKVEQNYKSANPDIQLKCLGGGKIKRSERSISIYGVSEGFGKADHTVSKDVIVKSGLFPNYTISVE